MRLVFTVPDPFILAARALCGEPSDPLYPLVVREDPRDVAERELRAFIGSLGTVRRPNS